jgi:AcrR family transcriptional regulator
MAKKAQDPEKVDLPTQEKIKEAARRVFLRKGFSATRTRDIAEEAGINLALLNYYFRSKQKLFDEVMLERVQELFGHIAPILFDPSTTLESKIESVVSLYIDMISVTPDLPLFVLSEIRNHPGQFAKTMNVAHMLRQSAFVQQLALRRPDLHPLHLIMNIMGMTLFPFIAMPVFNAVGIADEREFMQLMQERKKLIPAWIKIILESR